MGVKIKKNDTVYVRSGKDKGKTGEVLRVFPEKGKAIVKGVNINRCHQRQRSQTEPGGIVSKEAALPLSTLMVVDSAGTPGRVRFETRDGKKVRIHIPSGSEV